MNSIYLKIGITDVKTLILLYSFKSDFHIFLNPAKVKSGLETSLHRSNPTPQGNKYLYSNESRLSMYKELA